MSTERSGITIIIDTGKQRQIVNIPVAEDVSIGTVFEEPKWGGPLGSLIRVPEVEAIRLSFKPIGEYTIKKEDLP